MSHPRSFGYCRGLGAGISLFEELFFSRKEYQFLGIMLFCLLFVYLTRLFYKYD